MKDNMKDILNKIKDVMLQSNIMEVQSFGKTVEYFQATRSFHNTNCLRLTRDVKGVPVGRKSEKMISEILQLKKIPNGYVLENLRIYESCCIPVPKSVMTISVKDDGSFESGKLVTFGDVKGNFQFDIVNDGKNGKITNYKTAKASKKDSKEK